MSKLSKTHDLTPLKNRIDEFAGILDVSGEFTVDDFPDDVGHEVIHFLLQEGAIRKIRKILNENCNPRKIYQWDEDIRDELQEYYAERTELPCGHRAHIYNDPEVPDKKLGCKDCAADGKHPIYDRDTVRALL